MTLRAIARLTLWGSGLCAILAAVGLVLGISGDSLAWIYVSIAGSVLVMPLLAVAIVVFVITMQRERRGH